MPQGTEPSPPFDWHPLLSWLLLVRCPPLALRGRVLLLTAMALALVWGLDRGLGIPADEDFRIARALEISTANRPVAERTSAAFASELQQLPTRSWGHLRNAWWYFVGPFTQVAEGGEGWWRWTADVLRALGRVAIWGFFGGALMRIAAFHLARGDSPDLSGALRFAWQRRGSFWSAPLLLIAGIAIVALPLLIVRLAMQVTGLANLAAVLWPLVLLAAFCLAIYLVGAVIGWPLIWATLATDESDPFDAISRTYAYVYQQLLRLGGYLLVAFLSAWIFGMVVELLLMVTLYGSGYAMGLNVTPWGEPLIVRFESFAVWVASLYFTAVIWTLAAGIYLLRRHDIDGLETDEVYLGDDPLFAPQPPLEATPQRAPPTPA